MLAKNAARQKRAKQLNARCEEETFPVYSPHQASKLYAPALAGARRVAEVEETEALLLPSLDEERVASVLRDNPDTITLLGEEHEVCYVDSSGWRLSSPYVSLTEEIVSSNRWQDLPDGELRLPGGRLLEIEVRCTSWWRLRG